ncbi:5'-flap endonuclease [Imshaugia aleurites]|uniref:Structure-specific endonuclease subunit SLX4 n=1 Tax=Imshaugia aleurites TaxID=172621 RepID=A0A8H3IWH7_9LECA|nr:5'-flap endonuclease [Imshaugia aleurites]
MDEAEPLQSVKSLGLSKKYDLQMSGQVTKEQPKDLGGDKKKIPAFKKPRVLHEKHAESIQKKATITAAVRPAIAVEQSDLLAPKKSRKKKSKDEIEVQTTIKKTKITKPGAVNSCKKAAGSTKKANKVISAQLRAPASTQEEDLRAKQGFQELCLEKAITRRKEWTPCKDTAPDPTLLEDFEKSGDSKLLGDTPLANDPPTSRFGNLLGDFGFAQKEDSSAIVCETTRQENGEAILKRRKIELVNGIPAPRVLEPKRCKSPKKKPQTVTEKATAPFAPVKSIIAPSLLQYFGTPTAESVIAASGATDASNTPAVIGQRPRVKKLETSKPKTSKAKKSVQKQPILLSPESAMKNAKNQELIFGTSSQLVREESPSFMKDLQQAMKESESMMEQKGKDYEFLDLPSGKSRSSNVRAIMASRSLWSAASRDIDGSLVEVEMVNLADTPDPKCTATKGTGLPKMPDSLKPQLKAEDSLPSRTGEIVASAPQLNLNDSKDLQQPLEEPDLVMPRSVAEAALRNRPKSKSPVKKTSVAKPATGRMPNYEGFTDIQLRKEISTNGFKPIKQREKMITLLKQCWEGKVLMALKEVPANVSLQQPAAENTNTETLKQTSPSKKRGRPSKPSDLVPATADKADDVPPKKPRGRPKKDPTAATPPKRKRKAKAALSEALVAATDDEIYDSSPPTPSPPRRRSPPKSPGKLQLSQPLETSTTNASAIKDNSREFLFSQITKAVTTFPPTHDVKNLTWHEKMLMYDPIVLEDLTVWLNTEGLGRVGEDDEVCPSLVKEWCEERSVCCLWRENLKGGARGRW